MPTAQDLVILEQASDIVVQATIATSATQTAGGGWLTPLSNVTVLGRRATPQQPPVTELIDSFDPTWRPPGTYILFLSHDPGSSYYVVTNGLDGTFRVNGASAVKECANYGGGPPLTATAVSPDALTTVASLKASVPAVLPAYAVASKPSDSPGSPNGG